MAALNTISIDKLVRPIGTPKCPLLVDVRPQQVFDANPHLVPSATRCALDTLEDRVGTHEGQSAVVICEDGSSLSRGAAALLRHHGVLAEALDGGMEAWKKQRLPLSALCTLHGCYKMLLRSHRQ
jgi:rhodanese-related sulfurtransferase